MTSTYSLGTLGLVASYISTPYACAAGMLLNINGKFTMGKLK
jgi:hypothetical protein